MEATMEVDQQDEQTKEWNTVTKARFVMVSRDPMNEGSAIVNTLIAETDEEKALFLKGEGRVDHIFIIPVLLSTQSFSRWLCDQLIGEKTFVE